LHYTSLPRDELPLNPRYNSIWRCRFHTLFFLSLFSSPFDGSTCASLMDLTRGTIFDASDCIVSFMTLITLCMRELRYIMYLITSREVHYTKQWWGNSPPLYVVCYIKKFTITRQMHFFYFRPYKSYSRINAYKCFIN